MKLNYDGSALSIPGSLGGGGLLRAKLRATTLDGIQLCKNLCHFNVIIESDSRIVVDCFTVGNALFGIFENFGRIV